MNPSQGPIGEEGSQTPIAMMTAVVAINGQLARLWRNGIRLVRMMWIMSVCVSRDSTNQPVWKSDALAGSQQWKTYSIIRYVV